ncbi:hypothetical protein AB0F88_12495 [Streptosporangium sp. NPDC023963]|uniref:WD40 repeat domain-containing protein n=1 Tax=Streptosporangium sp. NPDC023963 TaxID=3155608 RepID=UPI0034466C8F
METSLALPAATSPPLPPTGPPRFFLAAGVPIARFPERSKTATFTPVRPTVHDAATGALLASVRLPPGVRSSWQLLAAAPDNRTFVLSGWTGPDSPIRFFRVTLAEDGQPGDPMPVPGLRSDRLGPGYALALSPDATRLVYAKAASGGVRVSVVELATGRRRDWSTGAFFTVSGLSWAPDGRRIALAAGNWGLGVLDLDRPGSDLLAATRLVRPHRGLPPLHSVAYTPDGGALVYSAGHAIERVPVDGGQAPRLLAQVKLPPTASLSLPFSLDGTGRYLLYVHRRQSFRIDLTDGSTTPLPKRIGERPGRGGSPNAAW